MKPQSRPTAVLVIAILNFVFGGLGLLGALCGGGMSLLLPGMMRAIPSPPQGPSMGSMVDKLYAYPGFVPAMVFDYASGFVLAVLLLIGGVGLLKMKPWGRSTCIAYAALKFLTVIIATALSITILLPANEKWAVEFQQEIAKAQKPGGPPPPPMPMMNMGSGFSNAMVIGGAVFNLAYAVAVLVVMFQPPVREAFRRAALGLPPEEERPPMRRRRRVEDEAEDEPLPRAKPDDRYQDEIP